MFGTLISTNLEKENLEFVENLDPVSAVSRNLRDKIHVSCFSCRSRKVRCSGERQRCQQCSDKDLECLYPEDHGRKRQRKSSRLSSIDSTVYSPISRTHNDKESYTVDGQGETSKERALDAHQVTLADPLAVEPPLTFEMMAASVEQSHNRASKINQRQGPFMNDLTQDVSPVPPRKDSVIEPALYRTPNVFDAESTSQPTQSESTSGSKPWGGSQGQEEMVWIMSPDDQSMISSKLDAPSQETPSKAHTDYEGCSCLLSSISFFERLVSKSATNESHIDRLLTDIRESIESLAVLVACDRCAARVEQNMLLAMAARQVGIICKKAATCYQAMHLGSGGLGDTTFLTQRPELDFPTINMSIWAYRPNQREAFHMLYSLLTLQMADILQHVSMLESRYGDRPNPSQMKALIEAQSYVQCAQATISSVW